MPHVSVQDLGGGKFSITAGRIEGKLEIDASQSPDWLKAFCDPEASLPENDSLLSDQRICAHQSEPVGVGSCAVRFGAGAHSALGVFSTAAGLREAMGSRPEDPDPGFFAPPGAKYLMFRCDYDVCAGGSGIGPRPFSVSLDAGRSGCCTVVQSVVPGTKARVALESLIDAWRLPRELRDVADLLPGTWILAGAEGSFAVAAGLKVGYDFSWIREIRGILKGDIGLKLETLLDARLGFRASGQYGVVLSRESTEETDRKLRLRLHKSSSKGWELAIDGVAAESLSASSITAAFDELLSAALGTHHQQIIKMLGQAEAWTDPQKPVFGPFVGLADSEARRLVQSITGVTDLEAGFADIKARFQKLACQWEVLPAPAAKLVWSRLPDAKAVGEVAGVAALQQSAGLISEILDGGALQGLLVRLRDEISARLDLGQIQAAVDGASLNRLDAWLRARLEDFLENDLAGANGLKLLKRLQSGLAALVARRDELCGQTLQALKRKYEFSLQAAYQQTRSSSALLDVVFDFGLPGSRAAEGLAAALDGRLDDLLANHREGVSIEDGWLAYGIRRETHVSLVFPFFSGNTSHLNDAVGRLSTLHEENGDLSYTLESADSVTAKAGYSSALAIGLSTPRETRAVRVHSDDAASWQYRLSVTLPGVHATDIMQRFSPYVSVYLKDEFRPEPPGSFAEWLSQVVPGEERGTAVVSLSLSLPPRSLRGWLDAPAERSDRRYKAISIALQRVFKQQLHDYYFHEATKYRDLCAAAAVLAFCSIPPCSDFSGGRFAGEEADGSNLYWNYPDPQLREQALFAPETQSNLRRLLEGAQQRMLAAGRPEHELSFYHADAVRSVLSNALHGPLLVPLFPVESQLVEQAREAGLAIAGFRRNAFSNPSKARKKLAEFGAKLSADFHAGLQNLAVGRGLLPLGTLMQMTAIAELAPEVTLAASAMFEVRRLDRAGVEAGVAGPVQRVTHVG